MIAARSFSDRSLNPGAFAHNQSIGVIVWAGFYLIMSKLDSPTEVYLDDEYHSYFQFNNNEHAVATCRLWHRADIQSIKFDDKKQSFINNTYSQ